MRTLLLVTTLLLAATLCACGDDASDSGNNGVANNGNNGVNNGNNGANNGNNGVNNGVNNGNNGANNGNNGVNNGVNNGNNGANNGANNGDNNGGDPLVECQAVCDRVAMCEELIEACGEETAAALQGACRDTACTDDETRDQILAVGGLPCSVIVPQAIEAFGVQDQCEEVEGPEAVAITVTSDYVTSEIWAVGGETADDHTMLASGSGDMSVSKLNAGSVAVVDRMAATVAVWTLADGGLAQGWTADAGEGSNPHAVAPAREGAWYITRYGSASLLVVDADGEEVGTIDLSNRFDDGIPEMDAIFVTGARAYVVLQNLENFAPAGNSLLAVVDTTNDTVVDYVDLGCQNAFASTLWMGNIYVACTGAFGTLDGEVVAFNPLDDSVTPGVLTEEEVDGDFLAIARGANGWFVASSNEDFSNNLTHVGDDATTVLIEGGMVGGLARSAALESVLVCDGAAPGLLLYDATLAELEPQGPIAIGTQPPRQVIVLE